MCSSKPLLFVAAFVIAGGCKDTTCGPNTIDDNGTCTPADETVGTAMCGSGTTLEGDQCVASYPPVECDPTTTTMSTDPITGVTTCVGNGTGGGCTATFACPTPTSGKQTICGQLYDFKDMSLFQGANPTGAQCGSGATTGPCGLQILAFDASAFAANPTGTAPLATDPVYIDDCGRYRVPNITLTGTPYVALGVDDAGMPLGPAGITNTTGVALPQQMNKAISNFETYIVSSTTTNNWAATGGPTIADGIYTGIFRTHVCAASDAMCTGDAMATQGGVTFTKSNVAEPADDYYFTTESTYEDIDGSATATSIDGGVLFTGASIADGLAYSGMGGITDTTDCKWESHAAASLSGIVFFQVYRPVAATINSTCTQ